MTIFTQVMLGLQVIHAKGFAHRDLKLSNILVSKEFSVKIGDLGLVAPLSGWQTECP